MKLYVLPGLSTLVGIGVGGEITNDVARKRCSAVTLFPTVLTAVSVTLLQVLPPLPIDEVKSSTIESQAPTSAGADATTVGATALVGAVIISVTGATLLHVAMKVALQLAVEHAALMEGVGEAKERVSVGFAHVMLPDPETPAT